MRHRRLLEGIFKVGNIKVKGRWERSEVVLGGHSRLEEIEGRWRRLGEAE